MTMLALAEPSGEARPAAGHVDPAELGAAIEYHRGESRRLAKAARVHRAKLRTLLRQRDKHITELRAAGWSLARIGALYKVTKERVAQITTALRAAGDEVRAAQ
jgi:hypothetical protein